MSLVDLLRALGRGTRSIGVAGEPIRVAILHQLAGPALHRVVACRDLGDPRH
jgi:hypothetical protein